MSIFNDKSIKSVADIAAKIMAEKLHPNQQVLDVHEPEKDKLTAKDFEMLRKGKKASDVKKEEVERINELKKSTLGSYAKKASADAVDKAEEGAAEGEYGSPRKGYQLQAKSQKRLSGVAKAVNRLSKEETEQINELSKKTLGSYSAQASGQAMTHYMASHSAKNAEDMQKHSKMTQKRLSGAAKATNKMKEDVEQVEEGWDDMIKAAKERAGPQPSGGAGIKQGTRYGGGRQRDEVEKEEEKPKKKKMVKEGFTEMLERYTVEGLKAFVAEEPDNEQFTKELDDQKASMEGKKKQPSVAAAATQGVKQMPEEVELDEAAKWRQGYRASGHPAGFKHKSGEVGPLGGTYDTENQYGDEKKVPVQKHRDYEDPLKNREKTKLSTSGKPLLSKNAQKNLKTAIQQAKGKHGPVSKLPEEVELDERKMTEPEMKKKEEIVKSMKKGLAGFKQRYGDRAKEVMYATATKQAMKD